MSVEILYQRRFLKTSRGIIPMVQIGSSNCTMYYVGREILERNWTPLFDTLIETEEDEYLPFIYSYFSEDSEVFRVNRKMLLGKDFPKWFLSGVKTAGTIEDYRKTNPHLSLRCEVQWYTDGSHTALTTYCNTTEGIEQWLDKARDYIKTLSNQGQKFYFGMDFGTNVKVCAPATSTSPVIAKRRSGYVTDVTENSVSYAHDVTKAMVFESVDDAISKINPHFIEGLRFIDAKNMKESNYVVFVKKEGRYVGRVTRYHLFYESMPEYARKFKTQKDAEKFILNQLKRFPVDISEYTVKNLKEDNA